MPDVASHFARSEPNVVATYRRLLDTARQLGPVVEDPKKTNFPPGAAHGLRRRGYEAVVADPDAQVGE